MSHPTPERMRRFWDAEARGYDAMMTRAERRFFPTSRRWVCSRAVGHVLEVGIGTGLNLAHYPADVTLTGVELSPAMLDGARRRARDVGRAVKLDQGDAMALPYGDASFDTVTCTFVLCTVPDDRAALAEMARVLRPGGRLLLADHVVATSGWVRALERFVELFTVPLQGEHFTRRPRLHVDRLGFEAVETERRTLGAIEHVHAVVPHAGVSART